MPEGQDLLDFQLNNRPGRVQIDGNGRFVIRRIPSGDLRFTIESDSVEGSLTIRDVQPGERVEVEVTIDGDTLQISIKRRIPPENPTPREDDDPTDHDHDSDYRDHDHRHHHYRNEKIELKGHDQVYVLPPGVHLGDLIIKGDRVSVYGSSDCGDEPTVLDGDLKIEGHDAWVEGIEVLGRTRIYGDRAEVNESCR